MSAPRRYGMVWHVVNGEPPSLHGHLEQRRNISSELQDVYSARVCMYVCMYVSRSNLKHLHLIRAHHITILPMALIMMVMTGLTRGAGTAPVHRSSTLLSLKFGTCQESTGLHWTVDLELERAGEIRKLKEKRETEREKRLNDDNYNRTGGDNYSIDCDNYSNNDSNTYIDSIHIIHTTTGLYLTWPLSIPASFTTQNSL